MKKRNVTVVKDLNEHNIVLINDICFKGRRNIEWNDVESYLKQYVGDFIEVIESKDIIYIGNDLADEYTGSKYTEKLKGTYAKAKANAAQGIPELVEIATNRRYKENFEKSTVVMQNMVGIDMIHVLHWLYMMIVGKLRDIMSFMLNCL